MKRVGIVICNYNKEKEVVECIKAVLENKYTDYKIYVVDNASVDKSVERISAIKQGKDIELIVNKENLGGSGGFNTGLKKAYENGHEYLMCVDNDAILDEDCIGNMVEFLDKEPEVGIVAPKIYHLDAPGLIQQYGSFINYEDYYVDSIYLNHEEDGTLPEIVYSDAVPACALLIRRSVVEKIGFMPEENFLYWDDTEWCCRCTDAGYKVASIGCAAAAHAMGAKKEAVNTFPTYYAWRNWIVFYMKRLNKDRLDDMAEVFLNSIFEIVYEGTYRNEINISKTVMAAFDDAIHGVMGKAGEDRIFEVEKTYDGVGKVIADKKHIYIEENGFPLYAASLAEQIKEKNRTASVEIVTEKINIRKADSCVLALCESIFRLKELEENCYMCDLNGSVITSEEDLEKIINLPFAKKSFKAAFKPLFIRCANERRKEMIK